MKLLVPFGFVAGLVGGVIARAWMRWISDDPEFTLSGTLSIVIGFGIFGLAQSSVFAFRQKTRRKLSTNVARIFGVIFSLQLFVAAGSIMFPSVLLASLARWRNNWNKYARIFLGSASFLIWVLIVKAEILNTFGWSIPTLGRISVFAAIYLVIIGCLKPTVAQRL